MTALVGQGSKGPLRAFSSSAPVFIFNFALDALVLIRANAENKKITGANFLYL